MDIDAYNRECEELGSDPVDRMFWEEQEEERRHAQRVRRAYVALNAASRVVCRATKRRRIDGPSCRAETALPSLGVGPLAAAFSFLHPVELVRMEMTAKAVREPVDAVWRSIFDERVRGCRSSYPSSGEYSTKECRRAVVLEECWLTFRSDLGKALPHGRLFSFQAAASVSFGKSLGFAFEAIHLLPAAM